MLQNPNLIFSHAGEQTQGLAPGRKAGTTELSPQTENLETGAQILEYFRFETFDLGMFSWYSHYWIIQLVVKVSGSEL